jgi:hypothetical protein
LLFLLIFKSAAGLAAPPLKTSETVKNVQQLDATRVLFQPKKPQGQIMAELNLLVQKQPSWEIYLRRAYQHYHNKRFAAAAADCEHSLALQKNPGAAFLLASNDMAGGPKLWSQAIASAKDLARQYPDKSYAHEYGAFIAALRGDFDTALEQLAAYAAVAAHTGRDRYYAPEVGEVALMDKEGIARLIAARDKGQQQKTKAQLLQALAAHFACKFSAAKTLLGDPAKYNSDTTQANTSEAALALALAICNDQMVSRAAHSDANVLHLVQQTNAGPAALNLLDTVYYSQGKRDKALPLISQWIDKEKSVPAASKPNTRLINLLYARARIYQQLEQTREATADLEWIKKIAPDERPAQLLASRFCQLLGDREKSLKDLSRYLQRYPQDGEARFQRAELYVMDNKAAAAADDLTVAITNGYHLDKALRARAACYRALHKDSLAESDIALAEKFKIDLYMVRLLCQGVGN